MIKLFFILLKILTVVRLISYQLSFTQTIPTSFYDYKIKKYLHFFGKDWENKSNIFQIRFDNNLLNDTINTKRSNIINQSSFHSYNDKKSISHFSKMLFKNKVYIYLNAKIVNDISVFDNYTGLPRNKRRFGYYSGETDLSGIGFENEDFIIQFGRGRESLGTGQDMNLLINSNSVSYDYGLFGINYNNIRLRYFHGFLENINSVNRYINGRSIEYSNKKSAIISLSEVVIYSGINRPLDIAYLNPIATHLEIELNNRQNVLGLSDANAVWQISHDWMINNNLRASHNFFIDELVIDNEERKTNKSHGLAFSSMYSYSSVYNKIKLTIFSKHKYIGTHAFRHGNGMNNFVSRDKVLGSKLGSDAQSIRLGVNLINEAGNLISLDLGFNKLGEASIINNKYSAYEDHFKKTFPSGEITKFYDFNFNLVYFIANKVSFDTEIKFDSRNHNEEKFMDKILFNLSYLW